MLVNLGLGRMVELVKVVSNCNSFEVGREVGVLHPEETISIVLHILRMIIEKGLGLV